MNKNTEEADELWSPFTFRDYLKSGGKWDLKSNENTIYGLANDGKTQFLFQGNLMESQDIGNYHFGAVSLSYGLFPSGTFILKQAEPIRLNPGLLNRNGKYIKQLVSLIYKGRESTLYRTKNNATTLWG